jgi:hypothetical protein
MMQTRLSSQKLTALPCWHSIPFTYKWKKSRNAVFMGARVGFPGLTKRPSFAILAVGLAPDLYPLSVADPVFPPFRLAVFSPGSFKGVA